MKMINKIAKTELRNLFYSPVAWFLAIAFMVQCAWFYTNALQYMARWQDVMQRNNPKFKDWGQVSLTMNVFLSTDGIFSHALENLFLFVPLLCMGLISREINNGTIKLLYSSPVKLRGIVLGKFLAIMLYNLLLLGIMGIFMVTGACNIQSVDFGMLLSAALGFYLLVCAYSAIGLFMSSLTTYQIVSAIGSFVLIFILTRIGALWQKFDLVRDLTYFLSLSGRTEKLLKGMITSRDIIYFVAIVYMFLSFTLLKLKGTRESKPWYIKARGYVAVIAITLLVGYVTSRAAYTIYWDATARKAHTIHPRSQAVIKELGKEPLEVTLYTNLLGAGASRGFPESRNIYLSEVWDKYVRFKPDIKFNYVYYYDYDRTIDEGTLLRAFPKKTTKQMAEQMAEGQDENFSRFQSPAEMRKTINLLPEKYRLVMQLKYKGRTTFLRTFDDNVFWPAEQQVAAAIKRLVNARLPKILFITGDLERSIYKKGEREYRMHSIAKENRFSLLNLGFDADTIALNKTNIPSNTTALVLADPKTNLSDSAIAKIRQYIDDGGNMLILGEPGKAQVLNPLLQQLGVQLMEGTLIQPSKDEMPHMVTPYVTNVAGNLAEEQVFLHMKASGDSLKVLMPGATAMAYAKQGPFAVNPLLKTLGGETWLKAGTLVTDSVPPVYNEKEGDIKGSFATALALTRQINNRQQRIVVCSDADFMSNLRNNESFMGRAFYSWLSEGAFPIYTPRDDPKDNRLNISSAGAKTLRVVFVWILPALVLLFGSILLIRRKRK
ncbi:ABC transporter [Niastella caeni]|uniref:ABC transporter n=1 Tax=Niastella caeni TaxID=2569763 RepID=A0A4S8HJI3_9BACT|nr:Gldg family protein [Niastella caeni]THU34761.1 ABC transporter [Niastella caeni]